MTDLATRDRLEAAFAREERRGLMVAAAARTIAVFVIVLWLARANPERGLALAWVIATASVFFVTGATQFWLYARNLAPPVAPYLFVLVDSLALAILLLAPNAWTLGFTWIVRQPGVIVDPRGGVDVATMLGTYFNPNYVSRLKFQNELLVFAVVGIGLALLVRRSRTLVTERAEAERARGNLARYFSPKVVDVLAERDEPLGRVRRQAVGVLFADLVGFTTMAEEMTPEAVMAMLRDFHGRMEEEVFRHGGCLEKFIGDALLATFGVPDVGKRDATDTLACARGMLAALDGWNRERAAAGLPPMRMGLGLHYGQVVAGDIGSRRSMAFATVGDTTNVASRLQSLTRELGATLVVSGALVSAIEREAANVALLEGLKPRGPHTLRGRDTAIDLWADS